ncbi:CheR family methyltransferase, partial [Acidovorax sp. NPDC077664]
MSLLKKAKTADIEQHLLIDAIYHRYHYDFRGYSPASLKRRLNTALIEFQCKTLSQLQDRVLHEPHVFPALLEYLTVQVSDMFRDPTYFRSLREEVVPLLRTYPSLKVWVAGCSAGEEVYSLAILLQEEGLLDRTLIYATDINPHALRLAESGVFDLARVAAFTENHARSGARSSLSDYYTARYGRVVFDKSLREHVVFSD